LATKSHDRASKSDPSKGRGDAVRAPAPAGELSKRPAPTQSSGWCSSRPGHRKSSLTHGNGEGDASDWPIALGEQGEWRMSRGAFAHTLERPRPVN